MARSVDALLLRPAYRSDQNLIKVMVRRARLNPFGLKWERFTIAENKGGEIVGCVQLKPHGDGSQELASLVVSRPWRRLGVGSRLVSAVKTQADGELWLMCRQSLVTYYRRFGFEAVHDVSAMSPYFRRIWQLARLLHVFTSEANGLAIMHWLPAESVSL